MPAWQAVETLIATGSSSGEQVIGGPAVPAGESVYHYLHDVLGSVVALTNATGQVVERYTYDPYGKTVIEETNPATGLPTTRLEASAFGNPFAWTGQRYDAGVRLYHFLFRGYSPQLGRWLQRDPIGYTEGFNLYEYVTSSPLRWLDLLGLERVISIHSNVTGGDKTGGHAWIEVRDTQTGERHSYGLWPDEHPLTENNGPGNDVRKDLEKDRGDDSVSGEHELTPEEEKKLEERLREDKTWKPTYNCASWASECWEEVTGEKLPAKDPGALGIKTPRQLGKSINKKNQGDCTDKKKGGDSSGSGGGDSSGSDK